MEKLQTLFVEQWTYVLTVVLMLIGLYGMLLKRNLVKKLIGMNIFQGAIILYYILFGFKRLPSGTPASVPVLNTQHSTDPELYMNPIPHALMLTAIVVSVATTGVALSLLIRIHGTYGTLEERELLEKLRDDA